MPSRSATTPGTSVRRWCSSSVRARLIRPVNYPPGTPGRGAALIEAKNGARALVMNAMGRIFMDALDDPFAAVDRELTNCPLGKEADAAIVDMHGEATSEKQAMGFFCDGRASLVVGTHTHVPTADLRIMSGGTAFMSDVGMTGDYNSVIGMGKDEPLTRFLAQNPVGAVRAGVRAGDIVRGRGRNRCRNWLGLARRRACASAAASNRQRRRFGSEIAAPADLYFRPIQHYESPLRASLRSAP